MAAAYASVAADFVTGGLDTDCVVPKPSGLAAGDIMVGLGVCIDSRAIAPPSGWTEIKNFTSGVFRFFAWTRTATSGDASATDFTFTADGNFSSAGVVVVRVTGGTETGAVAEAATTANDTTIDTPAITTIANDSLVLWGFAITFVQTATSFSRGTERYDTPGAESSLPVASEAIATAGAQTACTIVKSGFGACPGFAVAIAPAAAPAGNPWYAYAQQ